MTRLKGRFIPRLIRFVLTATFLLWGTAAATAATITVTNLGDSGAGTLRDAISASASGGAINFGVTGTITLTSGELYIGKPLTITGPGVSLLTVSGNNASRVFEVASGPVRISGMTIQNGNPGSLGGGIYNMGDLVIRDCTITGNVAAASIGGGIYNSGLLEIYGTTISSNSGSLAGGGISNSGVLTIMGSSISSNSSPSYGAGINNSGSLTVVASTISGNTGTSLCSGGGIYNSGSPVVISGSTISGNTTGSGGGGGLYNTAGPVSITDSTISNNSAPGYVGGGIRNYGTMTISYSSITGNQTPAGLSGGIDNAFTATMTVTNSTISDNHGGLAGGGIGNAGTMTIAGSTISYNQGSAAAGINTSGTLDMQNCTITANTASPGTGGGIVHGGGTVTLLNCTVGGNQALSGGGITGTNASQALFSLRNTIVSNNGENCSGVFVSLGHNLSNDNSCASYFTATGDLNNTDPYLGLLTYNGGWTMTHSLPPGSPAIDSGDPGNLPATDQRGWPRSSGARVDVGAVEVMSSRLLTITKSGTGTGRVRSAPGGIDCPMSCTADVSIFPYNGRVALSAVPDPGLSIFTGWSGAGCSDSMTMASDKACGVAFTLCVGNPVQDPLSNLYASIGEAYDVIAAGNLKITASHRLEKLTFDRAVDIGLVGGYACDLVSRVGLTYISGGATIYYGSVVFDGIVLL